MTYVLLGMAKPTNKKELQIPNGVRRPPPTAKPAAKTIRTVLGELLSRFIAGECFTRAQALAFVGICSLVPVLLCALTVLSFVIHDAGQVVSYIHAVSRQLLPGSQATAAADAFIQQTNIVATAQTLMHGKWWAITIGIGSFVWAAISLLASATEPMNIAWQVKETRNFVKLRLVCLAALVLTVMLFGISLALTSGPDLVKRIVEPWLGQPSATSVWVKLLFEMAAWAIDIAMFALLYQILPNTKVPGRAALFGGVIAGLAWELFKSGFAAFLLHFSSFNKFYGTLGGLFLLLTWIYYSCIVLLAGAIICKMYAERKRA